MKVLWICGLPNAVRVEACKRTLTYGPTAAWSWILGHLPPPKNIELHIICPVGGLIDERVDFEYFGAYWHCFKRHRFELPLLWMRFYFQIRNFVKMLSPSVIHGWGGETGCGWVATLLTKNAVISVQGLLLLFRELLKVTGTRATGGFSSLIRFKLEKATYRRAKVCLVESDASKQGLLEYYGHSGIIVHHPLRKEFVDLDLLCREALAEKPVKIVFVGTFNERKGAMDALRSFEKVATSNTQFVMIGDGPLRNKLEEIIEEKNLREHVRLLGTRNVGEIVAEFSNAQFFLLPSYGDTGPTALKEALACGLYPICYDNSGPKDLILHYRCGSRCATGDVEQLSDVLKKCIADKKRCIAEGIMAAHKVRKELTSNAVWNELQLIYKKVKKWCAKQSSAELTE